MILWFRGSILAVRVISSPPPPPPLPNPPSPFSLGNVYCCLLAVQIMKFHCPKIVVCVHVRACPRVCVYV